MKMQRDVSVNGDKERTAKGSQLTRVVPPSFSVPFIVMGVEGAVFFCRIGNCFLKYDRKVCRKRPRSARENAEAHSLFCAKILPTDRCTPLAQTCTVIPAGNKTDGCSRDKPWG